MNALAPIRKLDRLQQRHRLLAVPVATTKAFGTDQASTYAVAVAFYAFFSMFPLLLVLTTVLGYVLAGDHSLMRSVETSVLGRFPVIGNAVHSRTLKGSAPALIIGVVLSLWSGLSVTGAAQNAFDHVWEVPRKSRARFVQKRLRGVVLLALLGLLFIVASGVSGVVSAGVGGALLLVLGIVLSILLNVGMFLASFRLLRSEQQPLRVLLPGALVAAVLWEILQVAGGAYIGHIDKSDSAYGTFALVLGFLAWLHIGTQMMVWCSELNKVLATGAWPRPLLGGTSAGASGRAGGAS